MTPLSEKDSFSQFLRGEFGSKKISVFPLAGDASARKYFRIHVEDQETYVLMVWEPFKSPEEYPFLNVLNCFKKSGVKVPECISYSAKEGLVLLEDLGDLTLERKFWENQNPEQCLEFYKLTVDELLKMHYRVTPKASPGCIAFKISFDTEKLLWEMNYAQEHLLEKFFKLNFSAVEKKILKNQFTEICSRLHQEPKFIAHRDYHARNVMIKAGHTRVIDFQDARMGTVQYDLVSLLRDSYVDMPEKMEKLLLDYYIDGRRKFGHQLPSREEFDFIYDLQSVQRCLKACGSFASFFNTRSDERYLKYIPKTLKRVQACLEIFTKHKELYTLLSDHGVFEKKVIIP